MPNDLRDRIKAQRNFYRDSYRHGMNILLVLLALILCLSIGIVFVYITQSLPDFYASSSNGDLIPLTPMSTPNYSHTPLLQ